MTFTYPRRVFAPLALLVGFVWGNCSPAQASANALITQTTQLQTALMALAQTNPVPQSVSANLASLCDQITTTVGSTDIGWTLLQLQALYNTPAADLVTLINGVLSTLAVQATARNQELFTLMLFSNIINFYALYGTVAEVSNIAQKTFTDGIQSSFITLSNNLNPPSAQPDSTSSAITATDLQALTNSIATITGQVGTVGSQVNSLNTQVGNVATQFNVVASQPQPKILQSQHLYAFYALYGLGFVTLTALMGWGIAHAFTAHKNAAISHTHDERVIALLEQLAANTVATNATLNQLLAANATAATAQLAQVTQSNTSLEPLHATVAALPAELLAQRVQAGGHAEQTHALLAQLLQALTAPPIPAPAPPTPAPVPPVDNGTIAELSRIMREGLRGVQWAMASSHFGLFGNGARSTQAMPAQTVAAPAQTPPHDDIVPTTARIDPSALTTPVNLETPEYDPRNRSFSTEVNNEGNDAPPHELRLSWQISHGQQTYPAPLMYGVPGRGPAGRDPIHARNLHATIPPPLTEAHNAQHSTAALPLVPSADSQIAPPPARPDIVPPTATDNIDARPAESGDLIAQPSNNVASPPSAGAGDVPQAVDAQSPREDNTSALSGSHALALYQPSQLPVAISREQLEQLYRWFIQNRRMIPGIHYVIPNIFRSGLAASAFLQEIKLYILEVHHEVPDGEKLRRSVHQSNEEWADAVEARIQALESPSSHSSTSLILGTHLPVTTEAIKQMFQLLAQKIAETASPPAARSPRTLWSPRDDGIRDARPTPGGIKAELGMLHSRGAFDGIRSVLEI